MAKKTETKTPASKPAKAKKEKPVGAKSAESKSLISKEKAASYHVSAVKTPSGRKSVDANDSVAKLLRGKTDEELQAIAAEKGLGERWAGWAHLNRGQRRMALGNALRHLKKPKAKAAAKKAA